MFLCNYSELIGPRNVSDPKVWRGVDALRWLRKGFHLQSFPIVHLSSIKRTYINCKSRFRGISTCVKSRSTFCRSNVKFVLSLFLCSKGRRILDGLSRAGGEKVSNLSQIVK